MSEKTLRIENMECGYGEITVLKDLSLSVEKGEFVGILGPNGSGKTTLLRAITRVIPLKKGMIEFENRPISQLAAKEIARKIAVVSQAREDTFHQMTVEDMVMLGRIPHFGQFQWVVSKRDLDQTEVAMGITDVLDLRHRPVGSLSGGERQRTFIARALAQDPEMLLMDEPTMHLDIGHGVEIFKIIARLIKEKGITVICVLHDLNLASVYCKRLLMIHNQKIAYDGKPEEVIKREYIKEIYSADIKIYRGELSQKPQILF